MNLPTSSPSANRSIPLVSGMTNFFDQNTRFLKDVLVAKQKVWHLFDFDQIVYIYHEYKRRSFLKKSKSIRTKLRAKSFKNWKPVDFLKVFHSNATSVILLGTVSNTSVLDSL